MLDMIKAFYQNSPIPSFILSNMEEIIWINQIGMNFHLALKVGEPFLPLMKIESFSFWREQTLAVMEVVKVPSTLNGYDLHCTKLKEGWAIQLLPQTSRDIIPSGYNNLKRRLYMPLMRIVSESSSLYYTPELWEDYSCTIPIKEKGEAIKSIEAINNQSFRSYRILEELRCFEELNQSMGKNVTCTSVNLTRVIGEVMASITEYNEGYIVIKEEIEPNLLVLADEELLQMALLEVIKNGLQHVSIESGEVAIKAYRSGEKVFISIEDNGWGMSDETLSLAFTPFYCSDPDNGGIGLGLTNARLAILAQEGNLLLRNGQNRGVEVRISLHASNISSMAFSARHRSSSRFNLCNVILSDLFEIPIG